MEMEVINTADESAAAADLDAEDRSPYPYTIDPLVASVMPPLGEENYEALKAGISNARKVIAPLVVWEETGKLLDGHHRDRARKELLAEGVSIPCPSVEPMSFGSSAEAVNWVLHHAKGTRQSFGTFQKVQQIIGNAELMAMLTTTATKRMRHEEGEPGATVAPGSDEDTAKVTRQIAKFVGCSETTAKEAVAVCRDKQFVPAIMAGEITAHSAYRALRGHAQRQQVHERIDQNLPKAHEAIKELAKQAGTLLGKVHHCDVLVGLRQLATASVSAVITSPPYPLKAVKYPNWEYQDYASYLGWMAEVFAECKRILVAGGKLIVNFDNCNIPPDERRGNEVRHDCRTDFSNIVRGDLGMIYVDEYFWAKQNAVGTRPAIGTKGKPSGHRVNNTCEYVCIWAKEQVQKSPERTDVPEEQLIDLTVQEQFELSMQLWQIKPASRSQTKHRAAFPDELARRLIRLYTYLEDTVVDPFSGSGTTCAMAARMGRRFVGFDNAKQYVEGASERVGEALRTPLEPPAAPNWQFKREIKRARNGERLRAMSRCRQPS